MSEKATSELLPTNKPKIVYVMGAGRSGSTILGVALGNGVNIFDAGELEAWLRRSGIPNFGGVERNQFWAGVREDVADGEDLFGDQAWLCIEHSSSLFRVDRWRTRRRLRRRYRQIAEDLYRATTSAAGATHIVDTSHYPLRVRELQTLSGIDLYLIYLVRDPQDVVASFNRRDVDQTPKAPVATNIYLWLTHILSVFIFLRHPRNRRLFIHYEEFIADPENVLRAIFRHIDASESLPDIAALKTGIAFQGNRLLRTEVLALRNDTSPGTKRLSFTRLLQFPWVLVHGCLRPVVRHTAPHKQAQSKSR